MPETSQNIERLNNIPAIIKNLRLELGLSQMEFGLRFGSDAGMISKWESGKGCPSLQSLERIANEYGRILVIKFEDPESREKIVEYRLCPHCGDKINLSDPEWDDYNKKYWYNHSYHICKGIHENTNSV